MSVASALNDIAASVGREPALFDTAAADPAGARPLLDRADQALQARTAGVFAVTAYRPSGAWPLAWSGVPSEIGVDRIAGPEAFFVAPGPLGLRLVYIKPDPRSCQRPPRRRDCRRARRFRRHGASARQHPKKVCCRCRRWYRSRCARTTPQPRQQGFVIQSPLGQPLLVARVTAQAIQDTRTVWRENVSAGRARHSRADARRLDPDGCCGGGVSFPTLLGHLKANGSSSLAVLVAARVLLWFAPTARWTDQVFHTASARSRDFVRCFGRRSISC